MRRFAVAVALAMGLVGGVVGYAVADIPDATPSAPDSAHTMYLCVARNPQPYKTVYVLDKSQGNCPSGTDERWVVPAIPTAP